jgi:hypothetical protein
LLRDDEDIVGDFDVELVSEFEGEVALEAAGSQFSRPI